MNYFIKNMVCPRCIETVQQILLEIDITWQQVNLGVIETESEIPPELRSVLATKLQEKGFQLLENSTSQLINQIKTLVIQEVHHSNQTLNINFSTFLSEKLNHDYSYLSRLFSSVEGITIEKFILKQKTEKVKELLFYKELTLSEIAFEMNYSSVAHLSSQFKKETGMTPTQFKQLQTPQRKNIDEL